MLSNFKQFKNYETNCKLLLTEKKKNLFILHINIRSIYKNFDALNHEFLQRLNYLPDIICFSETNIKNFPTVNLFLTGYHSIEHADCETVADGVGIYISNNYSSKTIGKNTLNCNWEDIWIQISDFNSNQIFYFGVIYRHLNSNIINFISALNDKLIQLGINIILLMILTSILIIKTAQ